MPPQSARRRAAGQDADGSRERIHAAALKLFGRFGYDGVSLQMIADAVGLHKSTLFHHYDSKLQIAFEVFDAALERVLASIRPLAQEPARVADLLEAADALTDWLCAEPDSARLLMSFITAPEDSELNVQEPSHTAELERRLFSELGGWLERAKRSGIVRPLNVRQALANLVGLILFYPAVAQHLAGGQVAGSEPFSPKAVKIRKQELRCMLAGLLGSEIVTTA